MHNKTKSFEKIHIMADWSVVAIMTSCLLLLQRRGKKKCKSKENNEYTQKLKPSKHIKKWLPYCTKLRKVQVTSGVLHRELCSVTLVCKACCLSTSSVAADDSWKTAAAQLDMSEVAMKDTEILGLINVISQLSDTIHTFFFLNK